jgi:hypothetical protein
MEDKFDSPESAIGENDSLSENEMQSEMSGESFSASSVEDEPVAGADPPIIVSGGGRGGLG